MQVNYISIEDSLDEQGLIDHYTRLSRYQPSPSGSIRTQESPIGFANYHVVDVIGSELVWMNETFPKDKFTWYIWFESVFLVPEEMLPFLALRWA